MRNKDYKLTNYGKTDIMRITYYKHLESILRKLQNSRTYSVQDSEDITELETEMNNVIKFTTINVKHNVDKEDKERHKDPYFDFEELLDVLIEYSYTNRMNEVYKALLVAKDIYRPKNTNEFVKPENIYDKAFARLKELSTLIEILETQNFSKNEIHNT